MIKGVYKSLLPLLIVLLFTFFVFSKVTNAQMTGFGSNPQVSQTQVNSEQKEQDEGLQIFQKLQSEQTTCQKLTDENFNKLGDYFMWKALGNTQAHAAMDGQMTQMMGDNGNTQMHIILGKRASGCFSNVPIPSNTPSFMMGMMNTVYTKGGGVENMMGFGYEMMGPGYGTTSGWFWVLPLIFYVVGVVDLILLGFWFWKQLNKK